MASTIKRIQAAAIDGRAHNVYYRQTELERLCKALLDNALEIQQAISTDYGHTEAEVAVEFSLTLSAVKQNYASLQPTKAHEEEYLVARGKDAPGNRTPVGIVYIEPTSHTLFNSLLVPLSAALAAGNCVIVLLENKLGATSSLLRRLLPTALDAETFAIAPSPITDQDFLNKSIYVNQNSTSKRPKSNEVLSFSESRAIAVVDRTANIQLAAKELTSAKFAFGGRSPYAPDIVLVNEFAKRDFLQAVVNECVKLGSGVLLNDTLGKSTKASKVQDQVDALKRIDSEVRVILQESRFAVADLPSRLPLLPVGRVEAPVLLVYGMRSLEDAIDLLGRSSNTPYLASYHFSNPTSGKYLSQFVDSAVSFINHVPRELLVGSAFPAERPIDPEMRYPVSLFSQPRPAFINRSQKWIPLEAALSSSNNPTAKALLATAKAPLAVMKRSEGGGVGFFEQGFLMSASLVVVSAVTISATGAWYFWRSSRPHW